MIRITPPAPPPGTRDRTWDRWRAECDEATRALIRRHEDKEESDAEIEERLYRRRSIRRRYYHDPSNVALAPFHGKCVYCERAHSILDIEHFRPQKAVSDAPEHPGYYWLAYDIDNLLLACRDCNTGWKREQFPLEDEHTRAWRSTDDLATETPLLLHPFLDDPCKHLGIDFKTGRLTYSTERGRVTRELLGLDRDRLPEARKSLISHLRLLRLQRTIGIPEEQQQARDEIREHLCGYMEFTFTARLLLAHLDGR
jgi:hypothetical protein